uniref:Uncharacterized protein n=1 Tax=Utricularia reniformis TaxID=192314 RepID=A0A1Y0B490_9LAMI|nr:hypothetical protein AEK19_MT2051 [Utricularia reniformis]ART32208.1 hypothetical protein AEK19_MT2051 [Utricularia reniformis]
MNAHAVNFALRIHLPLLSCQSLTRLKSLLLLSYSLFLSRVSVVSYLSRVVE